MGHNSPKINKHYYDTHKHEIMKRRLIYKKYENPEKFIWTRIRGNCKYTHTEFNLDVSDIIIPDYCPILDIPLFWTENSKGDNTPSVDRIDPSKGYIKGNVAVISEKANRMKQNNTIDTLERIIQYIKERS